jgi:hypothetical protein
LGQLDLPGFGPSSFGPGKLEASDAMQIVTFKSSCKCFVETGEFQKVG